MHQFKSNKLNKLKFTYLLIWNMSKTPEDYRNIVKILKLQLLKVREENATLSHQMGMISDSETSCNYMHNSAFTPKLNHYRQSE